jgi:ABC-type Fe3+/spermidine/putrescine transport system ATPase subunit
MFDEPLSSLDRALKDEVLEELRHILHETRIPAVYVTHDQEEAFTIADRILLLHEGRILREGTPAEVWSHPGSAWVARFLNVGNVVEGVISEKGKAETAFGLVELHCKHAVGERVALLLKPSDTGSLTVTAKVEDVVFQREQFKVELRGGLFVHLKDAPQVGESISVTFDVECLSHA